jgi:hypothetical protein
LKCRRSEASTAWLPIGSQAVFVRKAGTFEGVSQSLSGHEEGVRLNRRTFLLNSGDRAMCQLSHVTRLSLLLVGAQFALASAAWCGQPANDPHQRAAAPVAKKHESQPKTGLNSAVVRQPITSDPTHGKAPKSIAPKFEPPKLTGNTGKSLVPHGGPLSATGSAKLGSAPTAPLPALANGTALSSRPAGKQLDLGGKKPPIPGLGGSVDRPKSGSGTMQALSMDAGGAAFTPIPNGETGSGGGGGGGSTGFSSNGGVVSSGYSDGFSWTRFANGRISGFNDNGRMGIRNPDGTTEAHDPSGRTDYYNKDGKKVGTDDPKSDPFGSCREVKDPKSLPMPIAPAPDPETNEHAGDGTEESKTE